MFKLQYRLIPSSRPHPSSSTHPSTHYQHIINIDNATLQLLATTTTTTEDDEDVITGYVLFSSCSFQVTNTH